jgi:hypothetical protein
MVYDPNTGGYSRADSIYGNVSAAGGFDQSEIDFVTDLISSGVVDIGQVARDFGLPESAVASAYAANVPAPVTAPESIYDDLDINSVYLDPSESSDTFTFVDDFINTDESGRDFEAKVFERGDSDVFQSSQNDARYYGDTAAPKSAQEMFDQTYAEAMANEKLAAGLETQLTPAQQEAQLFGLSEEQMNAKTEDMLDSIINTQAEDGTGFVNESARIAAEGILKGKIAQAGVTDPAAAEAALNSAMESLEKGSSGVDAVKAAAAGAQDYLEDLLGSVKDILDKGYDATIGKLPEVLRPSTVGVDPTTGQTTVVFGDPVQGTPVMGGQVGTVGGGTYAGVTTTGNAVIDAVIKAIKDGVDVESVIGAVTGLPPDVISGAVDAVKTVAEELDPATLDATDDGTDLVLTAGAGDTNQNEVTTAGGDAVVQEGVMGPFGGEDTSLDDVIGITMDTATPTGRERVPGLQLPEGGGDDEVDVIDRTPTGRERVPGLQLPEGGGDDEVTPTDREIVPGFQLPERDDEPPILDEEVPPILDEEVPPEPLPEVPEIPEPRQGYRLVQVTPGELAEFGPMFDISGASIFPTDVDPEQDVVDYLYPILGRDDIVQNYDIEELIRLLESGRG